MYIRRRKGCDFTENYQALKILFVRHAQTDYADIGDRDNCDGDLTPVGEEQCGVLGVKLKDIDIDAVFSSSLLRAFKTAVGICYAKSDKPRINICPEIIECGCTPGYYGCSAAYLKNFYDNAEIIPKLFGGCEYSFGVTDNNDNILRAKKFIDYIKTNFSCNQTVVVVSHHGILEYLIPTALGVEPGQFSLSLDNISVTEVDICPDGTTVLKYVNNTNILL